MMFLILATHSPDMCPLTNSKVREHVLKIVPEWKNMAERLGLRFVSDPLVNNEHMVISVVEASEVEALDEFINQSGMQQWNNVKMIPCTRIEDALKKYHEIKPIL